MADLINRDHAAQAIEAYLCSQCDRNGERDCVSCPHLDGDEILKSVQSVNRWIPCSERIPERFDTVLLAILSKNGYGEPAYYVTIGGMKNGNEFESYTGDICECETVTHWMPLPEPPATEREINEQELL